MSQEHGDIICHPGHRHLSLYYEQYVGRKGGVFCDKEDHLH